MKIIISLCVILLFVCVGCDSTHKELPPRFKLMCSNNGKYCLILPTPSGTTMLDANVFKSQKAAIGYAWQWQEYLDSLNKQFESSKYEWHECEINK